MINNPGFGIWPMDEYALTGCNNYGEKKSLHTSFATEFWCPQCYKEGKYSVLDWFLSEEELEVRKNPKSKLTINDRVCELGHIVDIIHDKKKNYGNY